MGKGANNNKNKSVHEGCHIINKHDTVRRENESNKLRVLLSK